MERNVSLIIAVLASALVLVSSGPLSEDGVEISDNIVPAPHLVGGGQTYIFKREYFVGFQFYTTWNKFTRCSGVRLNGKWMLTAAECLDKTKFENVRITVVYNHGRLETVDRTLSALHFALHPKYDAKTKANNIALVESDFDNWDLAFLHPKLPSKSEQYSTYLKKSAYVTGYNISKDPLNHYDVFKMMSISVNIEDHPVCEGWYDSTVDKKNQVCTVPWFGKGLDKNDVGAPLMIHNFMDVKLVGLALNVRPWSQEGQPIVFAKISPYLDWISEITGIKVLP